VLYQLSKVGEKGGTKLLVLKSEWVDYGYFGERISRGIIRVKLLRASPEIDVPWDCVFRVSNFNQGGTGKLG